jgi:D-psicose/D-tagatose/L-ribulose 3-epimerase
MKYGVNTFIWTANYTPADEHLLARIKEAGFDGVEAAIFDPAAFDAPALRRGFEAHGLECTVVSVLNHENNIISDDPAVRARGREHLAGCIRSIAAAGATILAGPLYAPLGHLPGRPRTQAEWDRAVECYRSLTRVLEETGVTVAIEPLNRFETYFLNTAADAARFCREVDHPDVGILLDTFHANIEEKDIGKAYRIAGPYLKHVHTCENDRGTPGSGHVEWDDVFAALRDVGYDGWLTIESFGSKIEAIAAAAAIWRDIEPQPDNIAFDGIRFLKSKTGQMGQAAG